MSRSSDNDDKDVIVTDESLDVTVAEESIIPESSQEKETFFSKTLVWLLSATAFLLPLSFLTIPGAPMDYGKGIILAFLVLIALAVWVVGSLRDGTVVVPRSAGVWLLGLVTSSFFVAALFSPAVSVSFSGLVFEIGTVGTMLFLWLVVFLYGSVFGNARRASVVLYAILASAWIMFLYQLARIFGGSDFLDFGVLKNPTFTLAGKLNDFAIFAGAVALLSLGMLRLSSLRRAGKAVWGLTLACALMFLALINFPQALIVVGLFSLAFLVYELFVLWSALVRNGGRRNIFSEFPFVALILVVVSLFFYFFGNGIAAMTNPFTQYSQLEVRPSWSGTTNIISASLQQSPFFGAGPNRFDHEWLTHKEDTINGTIFWNAEFRFGIGLLPSFIVMTGLFGAFAWLVFFAWFSYAGIRSFFAGERSAVTAIAFMLAAYLWVMTVIYVPGTMLLFLAAVMTALFCALSGESRRISFLENQKIGFVTVLFLIVLLITTAFGFYSVVRKATAYGAYQNAQLAAAAGDIDASEGLVDRALRRNPIDLYYRAKTELGIARLRNLLSQKSESSVEELRSEFQTILGGAIRTAQQATEYDSTNYANWLVLSRVYGAIVPSNIAGALENAQTSLVRAHAENPKSPLFYKEQAQLEIAHGDSAKARETLAKALEVKGDYTEALYLLAQLDIQERKVASAVKSLEQVTLINPNNAGLHFQLGILKYSQDDYRGATNAFARAIYLVPEYANARYFLGLSLYRIGDTKNAIVQFERVIATNPGNEEVGKILANLKDGKDPFNGFAPPPELPEGRSELPLKEVGQ